MKYHVVLYFSDGTHELDVEAKFDEYSICKAIYVETMEVVALAPIDLEIRQTDVYVHLSASKETYINRVNANRVTLGELLH